ncbi:MAG: hypothetical protein WKF81_11045 [Thermomicrobiales bacterium]
MSDRFPILHSSHVRSLVLTAIATSSLLVGGIRAEVLAAPGIPPSTSESSAQNVDWMSADMGSRLDLGFSVLVPTYIPGPFGGAPSVSASGGYYSLYWQLGGGSPTFLQISGTVGGSLPAGSPADLNNELFINANVQGYEAINDVTAIYDSVWWIAGGVLYQVEGLNVDVGSLSLANSLVTLVPPAPQPEPTAIPTEEQPVDEPEPDPLEPEPDTGNVDDEPVTEDEDEDVVTGGDTDTGADTDVETPTSEAADPEDDADVDATTETTDDEEETPAADETPETLADILSAPAMAVSGGSITINVDGAEASDLLTTDGVFTETGGTGIIDVQDGAVVWRAPIVDDETVVIVQLLISQTGEEVDELEITVRPLTEDDLDEDSDGTEGAVSPVVGGDGTGGPLDLTIPFDPEADE